jgi:hypothetical protein
MSNRYNTISNEQLLLINILNEMYNNNIRQINNHQDAIDGLNEANNNIRATLIQMLNVNGTRRPNPATHNTANRSSGNSFLDYYFPNSVTYLTNPSRRQNGMNLNGMNLESFFSPVEVYPTPTQVEAATRRVRYCDIVSPLNRSCPISLEEFNDNDMVSVIRQCGHIFKTDELNTWFRSNCRCPVCRYDIRNYNANSSSSSYFSQDASGANVSSNSNIRITPIANSNSSNPTDRMINTVITSFLNDYAGTDASGNNISPDSDTIGLFRLLFNNR